MVKTEGLYEIPSFPRSKKVWSLQAVYVIEKFVASCLKAIKVSSSTSFGRAPLNEKFYCWRQLTKVVHALLLEQLAYPTLNYFYT